MKFLRQKTEGKVIIGCNQFWRLSCNFCLTWKKIRGNQVSLGQKTEETVIIGNQFGDLVAFLCFRGKGSVSII